MFTSLTVQTDDTLAAGLQELLNFEEILHVSILILMLSYQFSPEIYLLLNLRSMKLPIPSSHGDFLRLTRTSTYFVIFSRRERLETTTQSRVRKQMAP